MADFIIDATAALPWCFEDKSTPWSDGLLDRLANGERALVPSHFSLEVANALQVAHRRQRLSAGDMRAFLTVIAHLPLDVAPAVTTDLWRSALELAEEFRLTAYEAAYLGLAIGNDLPLATADGHLRRAAKATGVRLIDF